MRADFFRYRQLSFSTIFFDFLGSFFELITNYFLAFFLVFFGAKNTINRTNYTN